MNENWLLICNKCKAEETVTIEMEQISNKRNQVQRKPKRTLRDIVGGKICDCEHKHWMAKRSYK